MNRILEILLTLFGARGLRKNTSSGGYDNTGSPK
jgi:hypothetical protein